jgi:hypothetical protein
LSLVIITPDFSFPFHYGLNRENFNGLINKNIIYTLFPEILSKFIKYFSGILVKPCDSGAPR